ncbi:MAG: hypothetical protein FRX48_04776 [Lasallia pustulata]|uniref:Transcriptional regulator n=1 Tax=Lasallia pustulata TaxID=136370 RepID=A0A5M8PPL2_9LECA|nr:MAG: hypothetical protein FRX48_04776 [Lasallia pustulata]
MSDSSLSDGPPSGATLEHALRRAVQNVYTSGDLEQLTLKRIRKAAEEDLDLQDGHFKQDTVWKEKSKAIIESEVEAHAAVASHDALARSKDPNSTKSKGPPTNIAKAQSAKRSIKRTSAEAENPKKRRRKSTQDGLDDGPPPEDLSGSDGGGIRRKPLTTRPNKGRVQPAKVSESDASDGEAGKLESKTKATSKESEARDAGGAESESEMSVLLDEEPKAKIHRRKSSPNQLTSKKLSDPKSKKEPKQVQDPDAEEIKRLQGWLVKCGIRKMWYKELSSYDNSKSKIRHLKGMLAEAGMTGRYSVDKANAIREERELKADLEAVQEGAKHWGKVDSEEESNGKPRRRLARGLKELDFLNDDDGEETD